MLRSFMKERSHSAWGLGYKTVFFAVPCILLYGMMMKHTGKEEVTARVVNALSRVDGKQSQQALRSAICVAIDLSSHSVL